MGLVENLGNANRYLFITLGFLILLLGVFGNVLVVAIFTSRRVTFKRSPCSLYFSAMAIVNTLHIVHGLTSQILPIGFNIDPTLTSVVYCKLRQFLAGATLPFLALTLECASVINQFLATSQRVSFRNKSTYMVTRLCIAISILFWFLHGIPFLILFKINVMPKTNKTQCDSFNTALINYRRLFLNNILTFVIPGCIMVIFGYLTLRNVRRLIYDTHESNTHQQIERQMSLVSYYFYRNGDL